MNILMIGPCHGHNIQMFLNFFEKQKSMNLTLGYLDYGDFHKSGLYRNIDFFKIIKSLSGMRNYYLQLKKNWDLIWIHRGSNLGLLLFTYFFKKRESIFILNIWGEQLPRLMISGGWKALVYKFLLNKIDYIQCNWYGTYELLRGISKRFNLVVFPWGLQNEYFIKLKQKLNPFTVEFVSKLPKEKTKFFCPRSILPINNQHIMIESTRMLKENGYENFIVYLWHGNVNDSNYLSEIINSININGLHKLIKIIEHPFISAFDIKEIWKNMDCGIVFGNIDQLSTTLLEPMLMEKELIASNISPYRIFEKKYSTSLGLIDINLKMLQEKMEQIIIGHKTKKTILYKRKILINKHFNFDINISKILDYYQKMTS